MEHICNYVEYTNSNELFYIVIVATLDLLACEWKTYQKLKREQ